jgi:hypothetical protein
MSTDHFRRHEEILDLAVGSGGEWREINTHKCKKCNVNAQLNPHTDRVYGCPVCGIRAIDGYDLKEKFLVVL